MLRVPEGRPIFEATNEFRKNLATSPAPQGRASLAQDGSPGSGGTYAPSPGGTTDFRSDERVSEEPRYLNDVESASADGTNRGRPWSQSRVCSRPFRCPSVI